MQDESLIVTKPGTSAGWWGAHGRRRINVLALLILGALAWPPPVSQADDALVKGIQLFERGQYREAETAFRQILAANESDATAHYFMGRVELTLCDYDQAIASLQRAVDLDSNRSEYHFWLGRAYGEKAQRVGLIKQAGLAKKIRHAFERAVALDPSSVEARLGLGNFYAQAPRFMGGGIDKATEQATALAALDRFEAELLRARIVEEQKGPEDAGPLYRKLEEAYGNTARAFELYGQYGKYLLRHGRADEAIENLKRVTALVPDNVSARFALAAAYETVGRSREAAEEYREAARIRPECKPPKR